MTVEWIDIEKNDEQAIAFKILDSRSDCLNYTRFGYRDVQCNEPRDKTLEAVSKTLDTYYDVMDHAVSKDDKLKANLECTGDLELQHKFLDGNLRTMLVVTNILLIQNGFSATLLENPDVISGFSIEELMDLYKNGMNKIQKLMLSDDLITLLMEANTTDISTLKHKIINKLPKEDSMLALSHIYHSPMKMRVS